MGRSSLCTRWQWPGAATCVSRLFYTDNKDSGACKLPTCPSLPPRPLVLNWPFSNHFITCNYPQSGWYSRTRFNFGEQNVAMSRANGKVHSHKDSPGLAKDDIHVSKGKYSKYLVGSYGDLCCKLLVLDGFHDIKNRCIVCIVCCQRSCYCHLLASTMNRA